MMTNHHRYTPINKDDGNPFAGIIFALVITGFILALIYGVYCVGMGLGIESGMRLAELNCPLGALD